LAGACLLLAGCQKETGRFDTVVLVTTDTTNARMLMGNEGQWVTAPNLWSFFDEASVFHKVLTPRGLTMVALSSLSTGSYPRDHGIRQNSGSCHANNTHLAKRFKDAGYRTIGYSANMCCVMEVGMDEQACTDDGHTGNGLDLANRDRVLVEQLDYRLKTLIPGERIFVWLHLNQPHDPFRVVEEWYDEFHPVEYEGRLDVASTSATYDVALGNVPFSDEDLLHLEAVYASQLREMDENIGDVFDSLRAVDRYDDALIVFGSDHGEELAEHYNYFFHGCSAFNPVLNVVFAFRAPGLVPAGRVFEGWTSLVNIAPTITEIAGAFDWTGNSSGHSLLETMTSGVEQERPIYFERGTEAAGMISGDYKYMVAGVQGNSECEPYQDAGTAFPGEFDELYDLSLDPGETENLADSEPDLTEELRAEVCHWINMRDWVAWDDTREHKLLERCADYE